MEPGATTEVAAMAAGAGDLAELPLLDWGPRAGADIGAPHTSGYEIYATPALQVGVWECTPGGWHIEDRSDTETMLLLSGRVVITPDGEDGVALGTGDAFVLPRGWSGRWEIVETTRKFYVIVTHS